MSIRVLVNDHPHRTLILATDTHVLLFKHTYTPAPYSTTTTTTTTIASSSDVNSVHLSLPLSGTTNSGSGNGSGSGSGIGGYGGPRKSETPRCIAEFVSRSTVDLKNYRTLTTAKGTLGLITLNNDVFLCVATGSSEVATVRPDETVQRLIAVEFYCLNRSDYDHGHGFEPNPYPGHAFESDGMSYGSGYDQGDSLAEHPFHALKKLLSGGNFYYSLNFDLTRRLQDRIEKSDTVDVASLDEGLLWNSYMINPLLSFRSRLSGPEREALDKSGMLTSVIRGFAQTLTIPPSSSPIKRKLSNYPATLTVISRLSARRAGTRFNSRGLDDDGNVANFVETETVFWSPSGLCFSYVQVRGSIPVFWESSSSLLPGQQKIQITRSPEATQPSFDKHFERLEKIYGAIHIVNLLSETKLGEVDLSNRYRQHISKSPLRRHAPDELENHDLLHSTEFDFHERTKIAGGYEGAQELRPYIEGSAESFVYFLSEEVEEDVAVHSGSKKTSNPVVIMQQSGVFRVNCLDCLDRTNLIQGLISQMTLELFLDHRGEKGNSVFWLRHSSLWADNGDALSKIYAGTGALKSSFTRHGKMSLGGLMADARKSATRLYVNHFEDKDRQNTVDLLLGKLVGQGEIELFDPVNDWVLAELAKKKDEYESSEVAKAWVGTYNLNGRMMTDIDELKRWLPDVGPGRSQNFDIVAVAFQEIVELSPQQIMSTDPGRRVIWENAVKQCLNSGASGEKQSDDRYVLLRSGQLVGAALLIFVKGSALSGIQNVEGAIKKTGMSGMAGNKGAVAIRMDIEGSSICFVTAHLAAGFSNYEERNKDYTTISSGLRFRRDRNIDDHDVVVWAGDFNYRIGLSYERARNLVSVAQTGVTQHSRGASTHLTPQAQEILGQLYENDQLNIQMVVGHCFPFYQEGRVKFLPTYKFDLGKDEYDSSEKARIPAWTDRILWKVKPGVGAVRQLEYSSVMSVRFSDHKPVYSTFEIMVKKIDKKKKADLMRKLLDKRQRDIKGRSASAGPSGDEHISGSDISEEEAEDLMGYQSIQEGLPPASSDRRKWWQDGDRPVRSNLLPPKDNMILNDRRSGNPWRDNGEEDWVEVAQGVAVAPNGRSEGHSNKPAPPPPRRVQRKPVLSGSGDHTTELSRQELRSLPTTSPQSPITPLPGLPSRNIGSGTQYPGGLSRSASVASTATTATMMTARSSSSVYEGKKAPPPKPSKPASLSTGVGGTPSSILPGTPGTSTPPSERPAGTLSPVARSATSIGADQGLPPPLPRRTNTFGDTLSSKSLADRPARVTERKLPPAMRPADDVRIQHGFARGHLGDRSTPPAALSRQGRPGESVSQPTLPPRSVNVMDAEDDEAHEKMDRWKALNPAR